jgi:hypothetical protein
MPANDASATCGTAPGPVPIALPPSRIVRTASTMMRRKWTMATSLTPRRSFERSAMVPIVSHIAMSWFGMPTMPV